MQTSLSPLFHSRKWSQTKWHSIRNMESRWETPQKPTARSICQFSRTTRKPRSKVFSSWMNTCSHMLSTGSNKSRSLPLRDSSMPMARSQTFWSWVIFNRFMASVSLLSSLQFGYLLVSSTNHIMLTQSQRCLFITMDSLTLEYLTYRP